MCCRRCTAVVRQSRWIRWPPLRVTRVHPLSDDQLRRHSLRLAWYHLHRHQRGAVRQRDSQHTHAHHPHSDPDANRRQRSRNHPMPVKERIESILHPPGSSVDQWQGSNANAAWHRYSELPPVYAAWWQHHYGRERLRKDCRITVYIERGASISSVDGEWHMQERADVYRKLNVRIQPACPSTSTRHRSQQLWSGPHHRRECDVPRDSDTDRRHRGSVDQLPGGDLRRTRLQRCRPLLDAGEQHQCNSPVEQRRARARTPQEQRHRDRRQPRSSEDADSAHEQYHVRGQSSGKDNRQRSICIRTLPTRRTNHRRAETLRLQVHAQLG